MITRRRILLAITWMTELSLFLLIFTVSRWLAENGASLLEMGVVGGLFSLTSSIASVAGGRASDHFGHRSVMWACIALALAGEGALLLCTAGGAAYLAGYFVLAGAAGGIYPAILVELTRGGEPVASSSGVGRTILLFCIAWNLGLITSQIAGGVLFESGATYPLLVAIAATLGSGAGVALLATRRSAATPQVPIGPAHHEHRTLSASYVRLAWLANLGGTFAMSMIFHLFPKLMVAMSIDPERHGALLALSRGVIIATYVVLYRSAFWHHSFPTMVGSQLLGIAGLLLIALAPSAAWLAVGLALLAQLVGLNYFSSLYYSTTGSHDEERGAASGMHEATLAFGQALGSVLGGWAGVHGGDRSPYLLAAAAIAVLLGVQSFWYVTHVRPARPADA